MLPKHLNKAFSMPIHTIYNYIESAIKNPMIPHLGHIRYVTARVVTDTLNDYNNPAAHMPRVNHIRCRNFLLIPRL